MERHDVVAAALVSDRRVLLCHRSPDRAWYPNVWDLPGGHVNVSESPSEALTRELEEELGILATVRVATPLARITASGIEMAIWVITEWEGDITNRDPTEHDALGWFGADDLGHLHLADPAYLAILTDVLSASDPASAELTRRRQTSQAAGGENDSTRRPSSTARM